MRLKRKLRVSPLVTLGNVHRRRQLGFGPASKVLRKMVCKLKSSWKKAMKWHRYSPQYSYDLRSYCLNFNDTHLNDHTHCIG
ncbi:hypothetical protein MtrunA17_Chr7g0261931 [Medicago truncatula]|uniref:Uncharacterized protein n=1 Tax=Medicago truncatula TaxID=3880 RepID=G7KXE2_MEDTR|nr:hypothetical protein MTR_7g098280 [Medicago truncatula]RHN48265.1 hypothetical protein MtrunA17_Chr7g0261931 [Medicago truncatula]